MMNIPFRTKPVYLYTWWALGAHRRETYYMPVVQAKATIVFNARKH